RRLDSREGLQTGRVGVRGGGGGGGGGGGRGRLHTLGAPHTRHARAEEEERRRREEEKEGSKDGETRLIEDEPGAHCSSGSSTQTACVLSLSLSIALSLLRFLSVCRFCASLFSPLSVVVSASLSLSRFPCHS